MTKRTRFVAGTIALLLLAVSMPSESVHIVARASALTTTPPSDTYYKSMQRKPFESMAVTDGWAIAGGSSDITIAVLDTGVDAAHPDLEGKILTNGYNFVASSTDTADMNGHGTMVAGIIAANADNDLGVAGATKNCKILPVKVLDDAGNGSILLIAEGIRYAADQGADIINLSLGSAEYSQQLQEAVDYAYAKGILVVAASGNTSGAIDYPAACHNVLAVGAVTSKNAFAPYSNYGSSQALVAVGTGVFSTSSAGGLPGYAAGTGTSFAAPFVSSLAALLLSENSSLSPAELTDILEKTSTDLGDTGWDQYYGYGLINFDAALKYAQAESPTPVVADTTVTETAA